MGQMLRKSGWGSHHPGHVRDCAMAVEWAASGGVAKYGGDPNKLVLTGQSAGAHIAAMLALPQTDFLSKSLKEQHMRGLIAISGVYSGPLFHARPLIRAMYSYVFEGETEWDLCFPIGQCLKQSSDAVSTKLLASMCPTLLINASMDVGLLPHAEEFAQVLREGGAAVKGPQVLPNTDHFTMMVRVDRDKPSSSDQLLMT